MRRIQLGAISFLLAACQSGPAQPGTPRSESAQAEASPAQAEAAAAPPTPRPSADASAAAGSVAAGSVAGPSPTKCGSLNAESVVAEAHALGMTLLEEARDGEHVRTDPFERAMQSLRMAAEHGHRTAQSTYGRTLLAVRNSKQAPVEAEHDDYVSALVFLRVAAQRGDGLAEAFLSELDRPPFDDIPPPWRTEATTRAETWMACHGEAAGDRGVP